MKITDSKIDGVVKSPIFTRPSTLDGTKKKKALPQKAQNELNH